ncbi:flagellar protein MotY [Oceanospirillum sediminis]|uniref:OmpA family protein n=1 Tax=Oceanospirillum sediminis TaxID=2760088 RepID=A0A839INM5_9GAMM|nr:OmpA family protein [Oceanospirillum sediminis]MBB1486294.1 OmpA family protein [Oceanospirillum sediminis]
MSVFRQLKTTFVSAMSALALISTASAAEYGAGIGASKWQATEPSPLYCEFWHDIPHMGRARFTHRSGEDLKFFLEPLGQPLKPGNAELMAFAPDWKPGTAPLDLGKIKVGSGEEGINIGSEQAHLMVESLHQGMNPTFLQRPKDTRYDAIRGYISALNFKPAYRQYVLCAGELLPVNFDQISRRAIYFPGGGYDITQKDKDLLDLIVRYIKADPDVKFVYLDGHSDSYGSRRDNRKLSKERTDTVLNYLLDRGLDEAMITARYHGERYPIVPNSSKANRAKNRRVTIRLAREGLEPGDLNLKPSKILR